MAILLFFTFNCSEVLPRLIKMTYCKLLLTSSGQALRGALAAGLEKKGELATTSLEFEFRFQFPVAPLRLSCQISANQHEAEKSVKNTWRV